MMLMSFFKYPHRSLIKETISFYSTLLQVNFFVKSSYWQISNLLPPQFTFVWNNWRHLHLPSRLLFHGWRIGFNILPIKENLHRKNIINDQASVFCSYQFEYVPHIFKDFQLGHVVWFNVLGLIGDAHTFFLLDHALSQSGSSFITK